MLGKLPLELPADLRVSRRTLRESEEKAPEVVRRTPGDHRNAAPHPDLAHERVRPPDELPRVELTRRFDNADKVMGDSFENFGPGFRSPDVQVPVHLHGVGRDHLGPAVLGEELQ